MNISERTVTSLDRPLGQAERFFHYIHKSERMNVAFFAEIEGSLNLEKLRIALDTAQRNQPALRTCILQTKRNGLRFGPGSNKPVSIIVYACEGGKWRSIIEQHLDVPFADGICPLMRCIYVRDASVSKAVVGLVFHHSIADGKSAIHLLREILRSAFNGREPDSQTGPKIPLPSTADLYSGKFKGLGGLARLAWSRGAQMASWIRYGIPAQIPDFNKSNVGNRMPRIIPVELNETITRRLRERSRIEKTTFHGALASAQLITLYREFPGDRRRNFVLQTPLNLRDKLTTPISEDYVGLYMSLLFTAHQVSSKTDFWDLARSVSRKLKKQIARGDGHLFWKVMSMTRLYPPTERGAAIFMRILNILSPPATVLSNLGLIDTVDLEGNIQINSLGFTHCPTYGNPFCSHVLTYNGKLYINMNFDQMKIEPERMKRISGRYRDQLVKAADS